MLSRSNRKKIITIIGKKKSAVNLEVYPLQVTFPNIRAGFSPP